MKIRQALTLAALSAAVILTPVAASAQPRGGRDAAGRGGLPAPQPRPQNYGYPRNMPPRDALPPERRDYPRRDDRRCDDGGGIIGAIAGGLLGNSANGRAIDRSDGRPC